MAKLINLEEINTSLKMVCAEPCHISKETLLENSDICKVSDILIMYEEHYSSYFNGEDLVPVKYYKKVYVDQRTHRVYDYVVQYEKTYVYMINTNTL